MFLVSSSYYYSAKILYKDFINEKKNGKLSDMTIVKLRSTFNLTVTQIRQLEKNNSNNKKPFNELMNKLISDDVSYKDAYNAFRELINSEGKNSFKTVYCLIGQFIVSKEIIVYIIILFYCFILFYFKIELYIK